MSDKFTVYKHDISKHTLPSKFTFPFYYEPHPLASIAAGELQEYIGEQNDWNHNFGDSNNPIDGAIGKMFGVLVVQRETGEIGYLSAFSGKLANSNHHRRFVPPVFDLLVENNFFKSEELVLNNINSTIEQLENSPELSSLKQKLEIAKQQSLEEVTNLKLQNQRLKKVRKSKRENYDYDTCGLLKQAYFDQLAKESIYRDYLLRDLKKSWKNKIQDIEKEIKIHKSAINKLKEERKSRSSALQSKIFEQYNFLNILNERKDLNTIFESTFFKIPPAGAGECAAPKLLQYAFQNNMKPIALAEFWWGQSPKSEIRRQGQFYPCCRGKCEPILQHMLKGIKLDPNPLLINSGKEKDIELVYEDEAIAIINKPPEFLSVPGKYIKDCVQSRLEKLYPSCNGPLLVHRLDMSTSGILVMAKSLKYHKYIQQQFIDRTINKKYVAIIEGEMNDVDKGVIDLPLIGNLYDRPKQKVCDINGKIAITEWKKIEPLKGETKIELYPKTGRTHQLRVHCAHHRGLDLSIKGDDLYGRKSDRLYLHAKAITFRHPISKEQVHFEVEENF